MIVLPFKPAQPSYTFSSTIDGVTYNFRVRWNTRESNDHGCWMFDVFEADGTPIARSIAVVLGAYLGRACTHKLFMDGIFVARDLSRTLTEPTFDDMGTRVEIWHFTRDEAATEIQGDITERSR